MIFTIRKIFQYLKLSATYPKYEKACYQKYFEESEKIYATQDKQNILDTLLFNIEKESNKLFREDIYILEEQHEKLIPLLREVNQQLSFFQVNYKTALEELYAYKNNLYSKKDALHQDKEYYLDERSDLHNQKDNAYYELEACKDKISDWHNSYNKNSYDLDSYKRDRDYAYDEVSNIKNKISSIKDDISFCFDEINEVKNELKNVNHRINQMKENRTQMFALKNAGLSLNILQKRKNKFSNQIEDITKKLRDIEEEKNHFLQNEYTKHNVKELQDELISLPKEQQTFLQNFYSLELRYPRKKEYFKRGIKEWEESL